jgi:hypothetical protein
VFSGTLVLVTILHLAPSSISDPPHILARAKTDDRGLSTSNDRTPNPLKRPSNMSVGIEARYDLGLKLLLYPLCPRITNLQLVASVGSEYSLSPHQDRRPRTWCRSSRMCGVAGLLQTCQAERMGRVS